MNKTIKKIVTLLGFYKPGHAYHVKISDIVIPVEFQASKPKFNKMVEKREYLKKFGKYESKVILTKDFMLVDGYTTYLICVENGNRYIEAYFID